jgi:hypothetical protein
VPVRVRQTANCSGSVVEAVDSRQESEKRKHRRGCCRDAARGHYKRGWARLRQIACTGVQVTFVRREPRVGGKVKAP